MDLLLHESAQARDDDRYAINQFGQIISVALGLIVGMAALFYKTYPKGYEALYIPSPLASGIEDKLTAIPIWIYIGAPLVPLVLISYAVLLACVMTVRSYYLRTMERRIHLLTKQVPPESAIVGELPIPSWSHLQLEITGQAHSGTWAKLNWVLIYAIMSLMMLGCICLAITKIPEMRLQVFTLAIDGALMLIPMTAIALNAISGNHFWMAAVASLHNRTQRTDDRFPNEPGETDRPRSLISYLVLPRCNDELLKALFIPLCFVIAQLLAPGPQPWSSDRLWHLVGFFIVFELLVYQARYLVNDVRDRDLDSCSKLSKRRFPRDDDFALKAAFVSFIARLVMAGLVVGCLLPIHNSIWIWHVVLLVSVVLAAGLYETARSRCDTTGKKKPLSTCGVANWTLVVTALVGAGYAVRTVSGLWLGGVENKATLTYAAIGSSLFGSMFVALTWALESTRASSTYLLAHKAHLWLYRQFVKSVARSVSPSAKVLAGVQLFPTPWAVTAVLATPMLVLFVVRLLAVHPSTGQLLAVAATATALAAFAVVTRVTVTVGITATALLIVTGLLSRLSATLTKSIVGASVVTLPLIVSCSFRSMRFDDLPKFVEKLIKLITGSIAAVYSWFTRKRRVP